MANPSNHAVSVMFFPREWNLESQICPVALPSFKGSHGMTEYGIGWHGGLSIWFSYFSMDFTLMNRYLPGTDILLGGNPSMMARLRLREDILRCHAMQIWWRKLQIHRFFFSVFKRDLFFLVFLGFANYAARAVYDLGPKIGVLVGEQELYSKLFPRKSWALWLRWKIHCEWWGHGVVEIVDLKYHRNFQQT